MPPGRLASSLKLPTYQAEQGYVSARHSCLLPNYNCICFLLFLLTHHLLLALRTDYLHSTPLLSQHPSCKSSHSQCAAQVMAGTGNTDPNDMSNASAQALPVSPLLRIPAEIREKVWSYVFQDTVIHYPPKADLVAPENFSKRVAITYTCKWIYREATSILASRCTLYITRCDVTYPTLPHCLRSAVLPYVRNMVVHDHRTLESALRTPLDLNPILAAAPSLTKVQIGHFHLHGQSRKYYSDLQSHVRILHDMIHGQDSPEKRPNYARRQIHDFLDGVRLQNGPERESAGAYRWLHDILLEKRPSVQVWISLGSSFMLMAPATLKDTHVAYLVSFTICILVCEADNQSTGKLT